MDLRLAYPPATASAVRPSPTAPLTISLSGAAGSGPTRLSAFDAALMACGVGDLNLIRLSSVIPPASTLIEGPLEPAARAGHGDLLYCVYADAYASSPGEQAWAGLGWSLRDDGSGAGLFVEHSGFSEAVVRRDIEASLAAMSVSRGGRYTTVGTVVASAECHDRPVCALAIASYRTESW